MPYGRVSGGSKHAILEHPLILAISFVGSSSVAKYIYQTGAVFGKRIQAQGGAKNSVVVSMKSISKSEFNTSTTLFSPSTINRAVSILFFFSCKDFISFAWFFVNIMRF